MRPEGGSGNRRHAPIPPPLPGLDSLATWFRWLAPPANLLDPSGIQSLAIKIESFKA